MELNNATRVGRFLAGIAALVRDPANGRYLLLKRSSEKDFEADSWECVTGRVDQGEGFEDALHREVREELGVAVRPEFIVGTTHFYRGREIAANELVGVIYACAIEDPAAIKVSAEHSEYRWLTTAEAGNFLPEGSWIKPVIRRAELIRAYLPAELLAFHGQNGFELDE